MKKRMTRLSFILLSIVVLAPPATLGAADFVVVAPDMPPAPIIVFQDAPPRTRDAAVTLARVHREDQRPEAGHYRRRAETAAGASDLGRRASRR